MKTAEDYIIKFFKVFIIPMVVANGVIYLIGGFIAMDFDYNNWWIIKSTFGRVLLSLLELMIFSNIPKWWEQYNTK